MPGKFELKKSNGGNFMFNLKAGNGQIILTSEPYASKQAAQNGIESVKKNAATDGRYERKASRKGEPFFVLKGGNGQVIGSSEVYSGGAAMENGIACVKKNAVQASVLDQT
jgi:uncharacterized protein